jgi:hypothetical protein
MPEREHEHEHVPVCERERERVPVREHVRLQIFSRSDRPSSQRARHGQGRFAPRFARSLAFGSRTLTAPARVAVRALPSLGRKREYPCFTFTKPRSR